MWIGWTGNVSVPMSFVVSVMGAFSYRLPGAAGWTNAAPNSTQRIFPGLTNVNITLNVPSTPLIEQTSIAVEVSATNVPRNAAIALNWGSSSARSLVVIPMSGYETLFPSNTIAIQDRSGNTPQYFYTNAAPPYNLVVVKLFVVSAIGITDVQPPGRVNMTIIDPKLLPVRGATNETMVLSTTTTPYEFIATWPYPSNSTQGTYQVWIDIIDSQNNVAYSLHGQATFGVVPPGFVPFPWNLLPYFIVGGVGAAGGVGGAVLYRRKRRRSYLIQFDHFNTLTGGELNGGTAVTVEGNTGSGKSLLLEQLMAEDLRNGRPCVFVTTGDFPSNIRANMKTLGFDVSGYEQNGLLTFVDGYSAEAGQESREKISIPSLGDLTTLGIKITSALPSPSFKGGSLYFDSLTPLASKAKPESIVSFVQSVSARVKGLSGKAFFTVGLGVDGTVQRQLEDTADCIVQMEAFEESGSRKRRLRIAKFRARKHQEGWALFTIEDGKGIIFYSKKPRK
jgi:KaiC/GvpD/RAD55 family RecA-like ATPase